MEPDQMAQSQLIMVLKADVVAPDGATVNTGSLLDYAIASKDLSPHLRAVVSWQCPWKPYGELQIVKDVKGIACHYPQMEMYPALPKPQQEFRANG